MGKPIKTNDELVLEPISNSIIYSFPQHTSPKNRLGAEVT